jgi:hypothetical protein
MIISLSASADTYITNKIIDEVRAINSNVGKAGTLDLFSLYDETGNANSREVSRALIKFNIDSLKILTSSILDIQNFRSILKLKNILTAHPCPSNFTISVFPLAQEFDEGMGRDVISFADLGVSNYISASENSIWFLSGCMSGGYSGSNSIDYITGANFGNGTESLEFKQSFDSGIEDLELDVSLFTSASIVGLLENKGFRISYTSSQEESNTSLFVKRFGSRHVKNTDLAPELLIKFDDSIIDEREDLFFNTTGSIYLISSNNNSFINLKKINGQFLTGSNCLLVTLSTGSFSASFTGSQKVIGDEITGFYYANIFIPENETSIVSGSKTLSEYISENNSITFKEEWKTLDGTKTFFENELEVKKENISIATFDRIRIVTKCDGPSTIEKNEIFKIRTLFYDVLVEETAYKFSYLRQPLKLKKALYRIRDLQSNELIYDFDENYTKLSLDSIGNYCNISASTFPTLRQLAIEFKINYKGNEFIVYDSNYIINVKV